MSTRRTVFAAAIALAVVACTDTPTATVGVDVQPAFAMGGSVTFTQIDVPDAVDPNAFFTQALGINSRGDIVGRSRYDQVDHGFLLTNDGTFTPIDVKGKGPG